MTAKIQQWGDVKSKNIKELFEDFEGEYEPVNIDWGEAVGDEIW